MGSGIADFETFETLLKYPFKAIQVAVLSARPSSDHLQGLRLQILNRFEQVVQRQECVPCLENDAVELDVVFICESTSTNLFFPVCFGLVLENKADDAL